MYGHRIFSRVYHLFSGCILVLACTQVNAYSGGVTTYRNSPTTTGNVERAVTAPAKTPELDATYQRTMRKAQTAAVAAKALGGILKTVSGISLIITVAQLASDVNGIWGKDAVGNNILTRPDPSVCTVAPCFKWLDDGNQTYSLPTAEAACRAAATYRSTLNVGTTYTYISSDDSGACTLFRDYGFGNGTSNIQVYKTLVQPSTGNSPPLTVPQAELEDLLKAGTRIPQILDELDDKGIEIPWTGDEIEDMPAPLVLSPRITTHPDGSKTIEQTTLTPSRGPDGKTIGWSRTTSTQQVTAPNAEGNTTTTTTTTTSTSNGQPSQPAPDERAECEKSPNTLGCSDLDTPTQDLPKETKNVTFSLESISWGASASCPPPWPINVPMVNKSFQMSYEPFCDVATRIRPFILAGAAFVAMLIVMAGIRS